MTQKYPDGAVVSSPGTVIISAVSEVENVRHVISPALIDEPLSSLVYIDFSGDDFHLGGSSFAQILNCLGDHAPDVTDATYFANVFAVLQKLIREDKVLAGHDISAGGLITTLLEMTFPEPELGMKLDLTSFGKVDLISLLFSEKPGVVIQVKDVPGTEKILQNAEVKYKIIGTVIREHRIFLKKGMEDHIFEPDALRDVWFRTSYLLDRRQSGENKCTGTFQEL